MAAYNLEQIDITILKDGKIKIRVDGVPGEKCLDSTKDLEKILGGNVIDREFTSDYYEHSLENPVKIKEAGKVKRGR